jgi:hypothetical protein
MIGTPLLSVEQFILRMTLIHVGALLCSLVGFFFCLHTDKNIAVLSQLVFFNLHTDKHLAVLSKRTFDTQ